MAAVRSMHFTCRVIFLGLKMARLTDLTAEAITDTTVRIAKRRSLYGELEQRRSSGLTNNLLGLVTKNLQHAEDHMMLLGRKTALERVAAFLVEMDQRMAAPSTMILPMTRRDIADYLGLTLETVSRALSALRDRSLIRFTCPRQRELILLLIESRWLSLTDSMFSDGEPSGSPVAPAKLLNDFPQVVRVLLNDQTSLIQVR